VKLRFTTLVNKRALHIISTPCVLHLPALVTASKALPEFLKMVLKLITERVNFIRARARLFKVLYKDELTDHRCYTMLCPNSYVATVTFPNFGVDRPKSFQCC